MRPTKHQLALAFALRYRLGVVGFQRHSTSMDASTFNPFDDSAYAEDDGETILRAVQTAARPVINLEVEVVNPLELPEPMRDLVAVAFRLTGETTELDVACVLPDKAKFCAQVGAKCLLAQARDAGYNLDIPHAFELAGMKSPSDLDNWRKPDGVKIPLKVDGLKGQDYLGDGDVVATNGMVVLALMKGGRAPIICKVESLMYEPIADGLADFAARGGRKRRLNPDGTPMEVESKTKAPINALDYL